MRSRLRALISRVFSWTPLSLLGFGALAGSLLAFRFYAWPREDYVARVALAAIILAVVQSVVAVLWAALRTRRWLRSDRAAPESLHLQAERGRTRALVMPRFGHWLGVRVEAQWMDERLDASWTTEDGVLVESVRALRRGRWSEVERRFSVESVFGLARVTFRHTELRSVEVTPWSGPLTELPDLHAFSSGTSMSHPLGPRQGDRVDMRPYAPGDPPRWILWKVFARTDELMVRTPEAAGDPQTRWALFLVNDPEDEAAAGIASDLLRRGLLGADWAFGCDDEPGPITDASEASSAIISSGGRSVEPGSGLPRFLAGVGAARLIVLAPPRPGPWLTALGRVGRDRHSVVWSVSDGAAPSRADWLYEPQDTPLVLASSQDRRVLQQALLGRPLAFVDRRTGRSAA